MTVSVNDSVERFTISGTGPYAFSFRIFSASDLAVTVIDGAGLPTVLTLDIHYTVPDASVNDEDGGTILLTAGTAATHAGLTLDIRSNTPIEQPTGLENQGAFRLQAIETALDRQARQLQDVRRLVKSSLRLQDIGIADAELTPIANWLSRYITINAQGEFEPALLLAAALTQGAFNTFLDGSDPYKRNAVEIAAGVTPPSFRYQSLPIIDIGRHGFAEGRTETQNAASIAEAVLVLQETNGGTIQLPPGLFDCDPFSIPEGVVVRGASSMGTILRNGDAGYFISLGGTVATGSLKYKMALEDVSILMMDKDGHHIRLLETCGASVRNIRGEGVITAGRTNRFLTIDGGNASSFFNKIDRCIASHIQRGYCVTTSGSVVATGSDFSNCSAFGDASAGYASEGLLVENFSGNGSTFVGGNIEQCGIGARFAGGAMTMHGTRFECTNQIQFDALCSPQSFYGVIGLSDAGVVDNSGAGYQRHRFYGCVKPNGDQFGDRITGGSKFSAALPADIPITAQGTTAQTGRLLQLLNSAGNDMYVVGPAGTMLMAKYRSGAATPVGAVVPLFAGEEYLETTTPRWYKSYGDSANTQWVSLN